MQTTTMITLIGKPGDNTNDKNDNTDIIFENIDKCGQYSTFNMW